MAGLNAVQENGLSLRQQLIDAQHPFDAEDIPDHCLEYWWIYSDLRASGPSTGESLLGITHQEIRAFSENMDRPLDSEEVALVRLMDSRYMAKVREIQAAQAERMRRQNAQRGGSRRRG